MNLGENIYKLRTAKNLSQGDLADALEVSRQSVSKWENNVAVPELEKLVKMAEIFGITIDELVALEPAKRAASSSPGQNPQSRQGLSPVQILGIVLLVFGGLCFIVFTAVGILTGFWPLGLFIATPFLLCGVICLLCRKNVGLKCAWAVYIPLWLLCAIFMAR